MNSDHKMLENAIAIDDFNRAIALINSGVGDINSADRSGATLLMRAVVSKDLARVKEFIKMGANVNSLDRAKFSALHFASQPTFGLGLIKQAINAAETNTLDAQLDLERDYQRLAGRSDDYREGVSAFLAKRAPNFTGK